MTDKAEDFNFILNKSIQLYNIVLLLHKYKTNRFIRFFIKVRLAVVLAGLWLFGFYHKSERVNPDCFDKMVEALRSRAGRLSLYDAKRFINSVHGTLNHARGIYTAIFEVV